MKSVSVDEYIAGAPKEVQEKLRELREAIKSAAPQAEESISYGIAFYYYKGRLIYFAYTKNHIGIYGILEPVRAGFKEQLNGYVMSKGTIQLPLDKKLPTSLIKKLVKAQVKANESKKK